MFWLAGYHAICWRLRIGWTYIGVLVVLNETPHHGWAVWRKQDEIRLCFCTRRTPWQALWQHLHGRYYLPAATPEAEWQNGLRVPSRNTVLACEQASLRRHSTKETS